MTGRIQGVFMRRASTARLATKYFCNQAGATLVSTHSPKVTSGHPASAHETKARGVGCLLNMLRGFLAWASRASRI